MPENPKIIAPDSPEEIRVAEVMQHIRMGVRQRQAELAAWGDRTLPGEDEQRFRELQASAHIRERPFVSHVPIVGRFIAFFREKWNSVSTKWYVRPMLHQQNIFNQTVVQTIQEMLEVHQEMLEAQSDLNRDLELIEERIVSGDRDATLLARKVAEGEYRARARERQTAKEWAALARRLAELEKTLINSSKDADG
jgi:hypothetical protein